jgi:hypothetical protein
LTDIFNSEAKNKTQIFRVRKHVVKVFYNQKNYFKEPRHIKKKRCKWNSKYFERSAPPSWKGNEKRCNE